MMQSHHKQWQWRHRWNRMLDALYNAYMNAYGQEETEAQVYCCEQNSVLPFLPL
jgi:hypothetical protein